MTSVNTPFLGLMRRYHFSMYLYILTACSSSAVMSLAAAWGSPAVAQLSTTLPLYQITWIEIGLPLGAAIGVIFGWILTELWGRKLMLLMGGIISLAAWGLLGLDPEFVFLVTGRVIMGFAIGIINIASALYIPEIAPKELRGMLFGLAQVFTNLGCLLEYTVGPFVSLRLLAILSAIHPGVFVVLCLFLPESPYYLVATERLDKAQSVLVSLRRNKDVASELKSIEERADIGKSLFTGARILFSEKKHWDGALVVCGACLLKQVTGGVAVLSYAQSLFIMSGHNLTSSFSSVILGSVKTAGSCLTVLLAKKFAVKTLLLLSCYGVSFFLFTLATYLYLYDLGKINIPGFQWLPLVCIVMYFIFLDFGIGPFPSFLGGEVLEWKVQSTVVALSLSLSHLVNVFTMAILVGGYLPFSLTGFGACALIAIPLLTWFMRTGKEVTTSEIIITRL